MSENIKATEEDEETEVKNTFVLKTGETGEVARPANTAAFFEQSRFMKKICLRK